jgi:hypothetical protein
MKTITVKNLREPKPLYTCVRYLDQNRAEVCGAEATWMLGSTDRALCQLHYMNTKEVVRNSMVRIVVPIR